jgi:UDP-N-acetylglucosamine 2-epimerase
VKASTGGEHTLEVLAEIATLLPEIKTLVFMQLKPNVDELVNGILKDTNNIFLIKAKVR